MSDEGPHATWIHPPPCTQCHGTGNLLVVDEQEIMFPFRLEKCPNCHGTGVRKDPREELVRDNN